MTLQYFEMNWTSFTWANPKELEFPPKLFELQYPEEKCQADEKFKFT